MPLVSGRQADHSSKGLSEIVRIIGMQEANHGAKPVHKERALEIEGGNDEKLQDLMAKQHGN